MYEKTFVRSQIVVENQYMELRRHALILAIITLVTSPSVHGSKPLELSQRPVETILNSECYSLPNSNERKDKGLYNNRRRGKFRSN